MSFHPLEVDLRLAASFWGSSCMSGWFVFIPEILRELRGWSTPSSCPWGAVCWLSHSGGWWLLLARGVLV